MHTLTLGLYTTRFDRKRLAQSFRAAWHVQTVCIKHAQALLNFLDNDKDYRGYRKDYGLLKQQISEAEASEDTKRAEELSARKDEIAELMNSRRESIGLTEQGLQSYLKVQGKQMKKLISSTQIQAIASNVWNGVEDVLFGNGKRLHIKKLSEFSVIPGKNPKNGARFYDKDHNGFYPKSIKPKHKEEIEFLGLQVRCKIDRKDPYVVESLQGKIKYCSLKRLEFNGGYRYYVILTIDGPAPKKIADAKGLDIGIDPGVSTMASVTNESAHLMELAPKAGEYEKKIRTVQTQIERSERILNPENFNEDGTRKKGRHQWKRSKACIRKKRKLRVLYRKKTAYTDTSHHTQANILIRECGGGAILCEQMDYKALAKLGKKTERQDKESVITKKDGTKTTVKKFKRKKRFGRSILSRSPSKFLDILSKKAEQYGGKMLWIKTASFKASQYDHVKDACEKIPLSQRFKTVDGNEVQRDLYSAFVILNADIGLEKPDRDKCLYGFSKFLENQKACIDEMKGKGLSMPWCFGF